MKLLTEELRRRLPPLYSQEKSKDPTVHCKFFTPDSNWTWFATEGCEEDGDFSFLRIRHRLRGRVGLLCPLRTRIRPQSTRADDRAGPLLRTKPLQRRHQAVPRRARRLTPLSCPDYWSGLFCAAFPEWGRLGSLGRPHAVNVAQLFWGFLYGRLNRKRGC